MSCVELVTSPVRDHRDPNTCFPRESLELAVYPSINPSRRVSCIHYLPFEICCLTGGAHHRSELQHQLLRLEWLRYCPRCLGPVNLQVRSTPRARWKRIGEIVGLAAGLLIIGGIILIAGDIAILVFLHVFYQLSTRCLWIGNSFGLARRPSPICGLPQKVGMCQNRI